MYFCGADPPIDLRYSALVGAALDSAGGAAVLPEYPVSRAETREGVLGSYFCGAAVDPGRLFK